MLSFDLCDDGAIVYSNGSAVYRTEPGSSARRVLVDSMIEQVLAV